jgi:hypothetical protein
LENRSERRAAFCGVETLGIIVFVCGEAAIAMLLFHFQLP